MDEIKIFKLNFDGSFDDISYADIQDAFTIINVLAIYIESEKIMYSWIGSSAPQSLMKHLPHLRIIIKEEFPEFRIIRYITIGMREEPFNFFEKLPIAKEDLYKQIDQQEERILPILKEIKEFEVKTNEQIDEGQYEEAIETLAETIKLAQNIDDEALETEQRRKISDITENHINRRIMAEVQEETIKLRRVFYDLLDNDDNIGAHKVIDEFKAKYENLYDLTLNSSAKALIKKDKEMRQEEIVQIKNGLPQLEIDFQSALKEFQLTKAVNILDKVNLVSSFIGHPLRIKWRELEDKYLEIRDADEKQKVIEEDLGILDEKLRSSLDSFNFSEANQIIEEANSILSGVKNNDVKKHWSTLKTSIAEAQKKKVLVDQIELFLSKSSDLKRQYKLDELKTKTEDLLLKVQSLEIPKYQHKLNKLKKKIAKAEKKYQRILSVINDSENKLQVKKDSEDLKGALLDCENLIRLSKTINNSDLVQKYSEFSEGIKKEITEKEIHEEIQETLKEEISELTIEFLPAIESLDISKAKKIVKNAKRILPNIDDDEIKEDWAHLEKKFEESIKQTELRKKITKIEIKINNKLNSLDLSKSDNLIEEGDSIIKGAINEEIIKQWDSFKKEFNETKKRKVFIEELQDFLKESLTLKQKLLFDELNSKIDSFLNQLKPTDMPIFTKILEDLKLEVKNAQELYDDLSKRSEESIEKELFEEDKTERLVIEYITAIRKLLSYYFNSVDIRSSIIYGKLQDIIYLYKDLVSNISQIINELLKELIRQFEERYKNILKENIRKLLLHLPDRLVDEGVQKMYENGLKTLEDFYENHVMYIEKPFLESLAEVTAEDEEDKPIYCMKVNLKLARTTYNLFKDFDDHLFEIADKIATNLKQFELDVIPKSFKYALDQLFIQNLNDIVHEISQLAMPL
jgi:hypothetical protein